MQSGQGAAQGPASLPGAAQTFLVSPSQPGFHHWETALKLSWHWGTLSPGALNGALSGGWLGGLDLKQEVHEADAQ